MFCSHEVQKKTRGYHKNIIFSPGEIPMKLPEKLLPLVTSEATKPATRLRLDFPDFMRIS